MRVGDTVRLTKKAIKNFYGTEALLQAYEYANGEFDFEEFVNTQTGFENGENTGIVLDIKKEVDGSIVKVWFNGVLKQDYCFYYDEALRVVK